MIVATLVQVAPAAAAPGDIATIAGGGGAVPGDGGPAKAAALQAPWGIKKFGANLYFSERDASLLRDVVAGVITTVAGGGTPTLGDGGKATDATLIAPAGEAFDAAGNLYLADQSDNRVRRIDATTRVITTVAGTGTAGFSGDGGPATAAQLNGPTGLVVDRFGNLFIADTSNDRIRRVDAATGVITTVAGNGVYASTGNGGPATSASLYSYAVAFDPSGNLFIADGLGGVRKVVPGADGVINGGTDEIITAYAGGGTLPIEGNNGKPALQIDLGFPRALVSDPSGNLFVGFNEPPGTRGRVVEVAAGGNHPVTLVAGDSETQFSTGQPTNDGRLATDVHLLGVYGLALDAAGNLYIADYNDSRIRRVDAVTHVITTVNASVVPNTDFAAGNGDGGPASNAVVDAPFGLAFYAGSLFVANQYPSLVQRIDSNGIITTHAGGGVNDGPARAAALNAPRGIDTDSAGDVFIADCGDARVRKLTSGGVISTVAGGGDKLNVGPATAVALGCPSDVAVVQSGSDAGAFYIADAGDNVIRKVSPNGTISTVAGTGVGGFAGDGGAATAAQLNRPEGITIAPNGDLLIADTGNNRVRRVDVTTGKISTLAGNGTFGIGTDGVAATKTSVVGPTDVVVDADGNLIIAEAGLNRIRQVSPAGIITTIAGNGIPGFGGDGGPARAAILNVPTGLQLDAASNLYFTDLANGRVRRIAKGTPAPPPGMGCGSVVTQDTTLTANVGPCTGDGLVIGADNIKLDLGGHTISGQGPGDGTHAGIRITAHRRVVVGNGTVKGFADGIAIIGGNANKIHDLTVTDNVGPASSDSVFGDGVGVFFSAGNTIVHNTFTHNGIYDSIGILGIGSNDNTVQNNKISDTVDMGQVSGGTGNGVIVNPFLSEFFPREQSLSGNKVIGNLIETSDNSGTANLSNVNGLVANNVIRNNGRDPNNGPRNGIGIQHLQRAQPDTHMLVENNVVTNNPGDGILVGSEQNTVQNNQVHGNGAGIFVTELGHLNQILNNNAANNTPVSRPGLGGDLVDVNRRTDAAGNLVYDCDANTWFGNIWGTGGFFPDPATIGTISDPGTSAPAACTTIGGHPASGGPAAPGAVAQVAAPSTSAQLAAPMTKTVGGSKPPAAAAPDEKTLTRGYPTMR